MANEDQSTGYVLAFREVWRHPVFKDFLEAAIWNFLYQNAFWKDGERNFNGITYSLKRGQIVVSPRFIALGFRISERVARNVIQKLEKHEMVSCTTSNKGTIITICNYDKFQCFEKTECQTTGKQGKKSSQTKGANKNTDNTDIFNTDNTDNNIIIKNDFDEFWKIAEKKVGKGSAEKAYMKARGFEAKENINPAWIAANRKWKTLAENEKRFIPHPSTWLNEKRWEDEFQLEPEKPKTGIPFAKGCDAFGAPIGEAVFDDY